MKKIYALLLFFCLALSAGNLTVVLPVKPTDMEKTAAQELLKRQRTPIRPPGRKRTPGVILRVKLLSRFPFIFPADHISARQRKMNFF